VITDLARMWWSGIRAFIVTSLRAEDMANSMYAGKMAREKWGCVERMSNAK